MTGLILRPLPASVIFTTAPPVRLALPAPVVDPTMAAINALALKHIRQPVAA